MRREGEIAVVTGTPRGWRGSAILRLPRTPAVTGQTLVVDGGYMTYEAPAPASVLPSITF
jgi:hypothetical protein